MFFQQQYSYSYFLSIQAQNLISTSQQLELKLSSKAALYSKSLLAIAFIIKARSIIVPLREVRKVISLGGVSNQVEPSLIIILISQSATIQATSIQIPTQSRQCRLKSSTIIYQQFKKLRYNQRSCSRGLLYQLTIILNKPSS